jgi:hypothetical protein
MSIILRNYFGPDDRNVMNVAASTYAHHREAEGVIPVSNAALFAYLDKHSQLSGHMTQRSGFNAAARPARSTFRRVPLFASA